MKTHLQLLTLSVFTAITILTSSCSSPSIEGTVVDNFGNPLPDVSVKIRGTQFQELTDNDGEYSVEYVPGNITILFTKDGYLDTTLIVNIATETEFPAEQIVMYKIPEGYGIYYEGEYEYILLSTTKAQYTSLTYRDGWSNSNRKIEAYYIEEEEELETMNITLIEETNTLKFIDSDPNNQIFVKLFYGEPAITAGDQLVLLERDIASGGFGAFFGDYSIEAKQIKETYKKLDENLFIRTINLGDLKKDDIGYYAFVDYNKKSSKPVGENVYLFKLVPKGTREKNQQSSQTSDNEDKSEVAIKGDTDDATTTSNSNGKYPFTSVRLVTENDLKGLSKNDL